MASVEMYYRDLCGFSERAERLLISKGVAITKINIWEVAGARDDMIKRSGGATTVPQVFIDGQHVGGSDDLMALERSGKLDQILSN